mgnify:CR=1 FL=1
MKTWVFAYIPGGNLVAFSTITTLFIGWEDAPPGYALLLTGVGFLLVWAGRLAGPKEKGL